MSKPLSAQVSEFHKKFGHPIGARPEVPDDKQVRFRLKLVAEEFFELLESSLSERADTVYPKDFKKAKECVAYLIEHALVDINLPEFVDALGDLDYVVEGTRRVFGVDGEPIAEAIHASNMNKDPVYVAAKDAHHASPDPNQKPTKPEGWKPPDVAALLHEQGWEV